MLCTSGGDRTVRIWKFENHELHCVQTLEDFSARTVRSCAFSPCGTRLAACSFDSKTYVFTKAQGGFELFATLEGPSNEIKCAAWSGSGELLATCSRDKSVWIWEPDADYEFEPVTVLNGHTQDVKQVKWHPTSQVLFSCSYDDSVRVWVEDDDDWSCAQTLLGHTSTVWGLDFNPSGELMVTASDDKSCRLWSNTSADPASPSWQCVSSHSDVHDRSVYSVSWSGSGAHVASGGGDDKIVVYELERIDGSEFPQLKVAREVCSFRLFSAVCSSRRYACCLRHADEVSSPI